MRVAVLALLLVARALACPATAEARQFDFWLGDWDVQVAGKVVARSKIQSIADGCIILENWMPFSGGQGKSWNYRNPVTNQWEQLWITDTGEILKLSGEWRDGAMRQSNAGHRHSFTAVAPDRVHQFCEESRDGGKTWQVVFDALYIKRE